MENKIRSLIISLFVLFTTVNVFAQSATDEKFYEGEQDDRYFEEFKGVSSNSENENFIGGANDSGYKLVNTDKGPQFIQRLVWEDAGYVDHYVITVEQYDNRSKKYIKLAENETETNSTEVSLSAGTYRYKIAIYNILGQLEIETEWEEFKIEVAYEPQIRDISPSAVYMEEKPDGNYVISGRNIRSNATIEMRREGKKSGGYSPASTEISARGNKVNIHMNLETIAPGKYKFVITNPGGLRAVSETLTVKYKKPVDFDLSAGYAFNTVLFDETIPKYFDSNIFPLSFSVKATLIPFKAPFGYFGLGLLANYTYQSKQYDGYSVKGSMIIGDLNFVYQKPFFERRFFIELFVGGGITYFMDYQFDFGYEVRSPKFNMLAVNADAGIAMQVYFTKRLFLDLTVPFTVTFANNALIGTLIPQITVGWQF